MIQSENKLLQKLKLTFTYIQSLFLYSVGECQVLAAVSLPAIEHFLDKLAKPNQCRYNNKDEATTTSVLRRFYLQTKLRREAVKKTKKQALRSKFLVTAKGWDWQTLQEIGFQPLFCESGCQPVHCTSALLLYQAVKIFINFYCQTLSFNSGCQPLYCTCSLVYWCTVHAKSVMNHACVMFCPCPASI